MFKYIVHRGNDYMGESGTPDLSIYNTLEEALKDIFGDDYSMEDVENYESGDGQMTMSIFKVDIVNNTSELIVG